MSDQDAKKPSRKKRAAAHLIKVEDGIAYIKPTNSDLLLLVDEADAPRVLQRCWHLDRDEYARARVGGQPLPLHHYLIGKPPAGMVTDHANGHPWDCRRENLAHRTPGESAWNRGRRSDSASPFLSVRVEPNGWWRGHAKSAGKNHPLPRTRNAFAAAKARDQLAAELSGGMARSSIAGFWSDLDAELAKVAPAMARYLRGLAEAEATAAGAPVPANDNTPPGKTKVA